MGMEFQLPCLTPLFPVSWLLDKAKNSSSLDLSVPEPHRASLSHLPLEDSIFLLSETRFVSWDG